MVDSEKGSLLLRGMQGGSMEAFLHNELEQATKKIRDLEAEMEMLKAQKWSLINDIEEAKRHLNGYLNYGWEG